MCLQIESRVVLVQNNSVSTPVLPNVYKKAFKLHNGKFVLLNENGFIEVRDQNGNLQTLINSFGEENFIIQCEPNFVCLKDNGKWRFLKEDGTLSEEAFDGIDEKSGTPELIAVCRNGKWGYADSLGNIRIPIEYEYCYYYSQCTTLPVLIKINDKFSFKTLSAFFVVCKF